MTVIGDIKRILLLVVGFGAGIWMLGFLLGINQITYAQCNTKDAYLHLQPTEEVSEICFPFDVAGTSLVAEALVYYDGPFLEDGSNRELFNGAALLLRNTSNQGITQAEIIMQGNDNWVFQVQHIPPKATVLVVERSGAVLSNMAVIACTGWQITENAYLSTDAFLHIKSVDMGTISVTNVAGSELTNIRLLYKNWLPQSEIYVGGSTYEVQIDRLSPGQTILLQPEHYAQGYSKFVRIFAEEI